MAIDVEASESKQSEVKLGLDGDDVCPRDRPRGFGAPFNRSQWAGWKEKGERWWHYEALIHLEGWIHSRRAWKHLNIYSSSLWILTPFEVPPNPSTNQSKGRIPVWNTKLNPWEECSSAEKIY